MSTTEQIDRFLQPEYLHGLDTRAADAVRAMRDECAGIENAVSYLRRLAQGRIEILEAERARRARGGSVEELVADLPRILGADTGRSSATTTRMTVSDSPAIDLSWPDGRERMVDDSTLANLASLDDTELDSTIDRLREFEQELSSTRHELHTVLDSLEHEIAARQVAGTA